MATFCMKRMNSNRIGVLVRKVENASTSTGDEPTVDFTIADCGTLEHDDPSLKIEVSTAEGKDFHLSIITQAVV